MSNHVLVLRSFSGLHAGQVLDASDWKHTASLEEDRYLRRLATDDVLTAVDCPCGLLVLPSANLHICEASARAAKVAAEKEAALAEKSGAEAEPPVTPTPPATPAPAQAKATSSTPTPAPTKATAAAGRSGS